MDDERLGNYERLLLDHLDLVDRVVRHVARRHHLSTADCEEFGASVRLKLVERDYAILRKFQQRSNLGTYLTTVIERLYLDFCISRWGKWRPSMAARRLGPHAVMLERLVRRDGLPFDEAVTTLEVNYRCPATRDELHAIFVQLPERSLRRHVGEEELALVALQAEASDASLERYEAEEIAGRVEAVLTAALADLAPRERLLLKLRFEDELKIVDIARLVNVPAKPLYRMLSNLVESLQEKLHQNGIDRSDIDRVVGNPTVTLGRALATVGELHDGSV